MTYTMLRNCCTSGNCFHCAHRTPFMVCDRIKHIDKLPEADIEKFRQGWKDYDPEFILETDQDKDQPVSILLTLSLLAILSMAMAGPVLAQQQCPGPYTKTFSGCR